MIKRILLCGLAGVLLILVSADVYAADPPKTYFKFNIPTMPDGSRVSYSPGWFGVMDKVPKNVTVLYYNDKDGYGYAYTTDTYMAKEAIVTTKSIVENTVNTAKDEAGIYYGEKIYNRWLPEIEVKEVTCIKGEYGYIRVDKSTEINDEIIVKKAVYCPVCGEFMFWYYDGLLNDSTVIMCPNGHKLISKSYDTVKFIAEDIK